MTCEDGPSRLILPPADATTKTICCEYCPVACGYKVFTWPLGTEGGPSASENALGVDYPLREPSGYWPSASMYNIVQVDGAPHHVLVLPDPEADVVNVGGLHSVRGGGLAQKLYNAESPTGDRLTEPLLRVNGVLQPISWDAATDIVAQLSTHVIETYGPLAWGMKRYSYGGYENVTAITKLAFKKIGSANHAPHHAPAVGDDVPGLSDAGIDAFSACFEDDLAADVLFIAGTDPYETKTIRFLEWMVPGEATIIHVDPRKTFTSTYAVKNGGLHLQLKIGTDVVLYGAIGRVIVERGWEDQSFINSYIASTEDVANEGKWRRRQFGMSFAEFVDYLTFEDAFSLTQAEQITGVSAAQIQRAAEVMTGGGVGARPKVSLLFEKGLYWSHNYENTGAFANLALLLGSTGGVGRAVSRLGGHQRGGQGTGGYPLDESPDEFEGHKIEMDTDRWLIQGNTRLTWAIGLNWVGTSACTTTIAAALYQRTRGTAPDVTSADPATAISQLQTRMQNGGMFFIHQDIYANETTQIADMVLPATAWGERDFARNNAERRLRLYEKFMDPPGQARDDWAIVAEVGRKMGYDGFDWPDANAIFEEAGAYSSGGRRDYEALVERARSEGRPAYDLLREYGTTGIQTPIRVVDGQLVGTHRLHTDFQFKTDSKKANFVFADWTAVRERNLVVAPRDGDELWVTNVRVNHLWNNLFDHARRPQAIKRWPANFLEINPADASPRGIQSGDLLRIENDAVRDQLGQSVVGAFEAVAYVTDVVPPGLTCTYFLYPGNFANSVVSGDTTLQPLTARYLFKLGRGRVTKIGTTELASQMPFQPRNLS